MSVCVAGRQAPTKQRCCSIMTTLHQVLMTKARQVLITKARGPAPGADD